MGIGVAFFTIGFIIFWFCFRGTVDNAIADTAYKPVSGDDIDLEKNGNNHGNGWDEWDGEDGWGDDDDSSPEKMAIKAVPLSLSNTKKINTDSKSPRPPMSRGSST